MRPALVGRIAWGAVIGIALGWELYAYAHQPRTSYPTMSSVMNELDGSHIARALALMLWLALGWDLVQR
jgi:hypothetical protein